MNHYVHKDGYFLYGRKDLLNRIVRSGSNRDTETKKKRNRFNGGTNGDYMPYGMHPSMFPRVHVPLIGTHPAIGRWPLPNSTNLPIDENKLENLKSETE